MLKKNCLKKKNYMCNKKVVVFNIIEIERFIYINKFNYFISICIKLI